MCFTQYCHCLHVHGPVSQHRLSLLGAVLCIFYKLLLAKTPLRREFDPEDSDQRHSLYDDETEGRGRRAGAAQDCISALLLIVILHCKLGGFFSAWINGDMLDSIGNNGFCYPRIDLSSCIQTHTHTKGQFHDSSPFHFLSLSPACTHLKQLKAL